MTAPPGVRRPLRLFEGYGIELEYMIVDAKTLAARPFADRVLHAVAGAFESEVEMGPLSWSNELVLHVIELKTNGPASRLSGLAATFQEHVARIDRILEPLGAMLLPTAMHPGFDPATETRLWPHEYSPVYEAYNRIFDCRGHGWSNLQSTHINLPFGDDEEFGRLHAAIRLLLPILPALAASSPVAEWRVTGLLDTRLDVYRKNAARIPSVTGRVVPEAVFSRADYERDIFQPMFRDIAPYDPEGVLRHEFLNSRGAIARFSRGAIEIRVLDIQECPAADLAIATAIVAVLKALVDETWISYERQKALATETLAELFLACVRDGEEARIDDPKYREAMGVATDGSPRANGDSGANGFFGSNKQLNANGPPCADRALGATGLRGTNGVSGTNGVLRAGALWRDLLAHTMRLPPPGSSDSPPGSRGSPLGSRGSALATFTDPAVYAALDTIAREGPLARRLVRAMGATPSRQRIVEVYRELRDCLAKGRLFHA